MDISFYISELLEQHGEISVPGLGYLVQAYMPGYYDESEGKFYPPHHRVQFDPQQLEDDDTLTQYIADKKNISLASSKYFTEKYIAAIREDALVKEVPIANLGSFYTEQGKLMFNTAEQVTNDPAFFGYPPVNILKIGQGPVETPAPTPLPTQRPVTTARPTPKPAAATFASSTNTAPPPPPAAEISKIKQALIDEFNAKNKPPTGETIVKGSPILNEQEDAGDYDETPKRPYGLIILLIVLVVLGAAILGLYRYYPAQFDKAKALIGLKKTVTPVVVKQKEPEAVMPPPVLDSVALDSIKKVKAADSVKQIKTADSLKKVNAADLIKQNKAAKIAQKAKTADSIKQVKAAKAAQKIKTADSIKQVRAAKAAQLKQTLPAQTQAKETKPVEVPAKQNKPADVPVKQSNPVSAPVQQSAPGSFDYSKPWVVIATACSTQAQADAEISRLKTKGIDAFIVPNTHSSSINIAVGAYKSDAEAEAAVAVFKNKGITGAYLTQIRQKK